MGIAFNVAETAAAANDMSGRITEVSAEAEQTEQHALSVRENAAALETAVAELRHAIIRVVRTSTTDVDRRRPALSGRSAVPAERGRRDACGTTGGPVGDRRPLARCAAAAPGARGDDVARRRGNAGAVRRPQCR